MNETFPLPVSTLSHFKVGKDYLCMRFAFNVPPMQPRLNLVIIFLSKIIEYLFVIMLMMIIVVFQIVIKNSLDNRLFAV